MSLEITKAYLSKVDIIEVKPAFKDHHVDSFSVEFSDKTEFDFDKDLSNNQNVFRAKQEYNFSDEKKALILKIGEYIGIRINFEPVKL